MDSDSTTRFLSGAAVAASLAASKSAADITSELISSQPVRATNSLQWPASAFCTSYLGVVRTMPVSM